MKYTVTITRTTGKKVKEFTCDQLTDAREHFLQAGNREYSGRRFNRWPGDIAIRQGVYE